MAEESERIQESIVETRHELEEKIEEVGQRLRRTIDVKAHIRVRPWIALGSAVFTGYLAGRAGRSTARVRDDHPTSANGALRPLFREAGLAVVGALLHDVVERRVPGLLERVGHLVSASLRNAARRSEESVGAPRDSRVRAAEQPSRSHLAPSHGSLDSARTTGEPRERVELRKWDPQ